MLVRCRDAAALAAIAGAVGCSADYTIGTLPDPSPIRPSSGAPEVLVTDGASLYGFSVDTGVFGPPTPMVGCDLDVVEIAQRDAGELFAAGWSEGRAALYRVDAATGACTIVSRFMARVPWALGFVRPSADAPQHLVGDDSGAFVLIDTVNGTFTAMRPTLGADRHDGDIALADDGTAWVAASLSSPGATARATLERVDADTGRVLATFALPEPLEGLATVRGALYGFVGDGRVVRVTTRGDTATLVPLVTYGGPPRLTGAASIVGASIAPR